MRVYKDKNITLRFIVKMKLIVTSLLIGLALGAPKSIEKDLETVPYTIVATHHVGDNSVSKDNTFTIPTCNQLK